MKKKIFLSAAILAAAVSAYAQGNGQAGITEATNLITGYFDPGTKLVYAIGAVCGLIGGVKVYKGEFYQFNLSSCIRQQNSLTAQFVSFSLSNLANIFYPPNFYNN